MLLRSLRLPSRKQTRRVKKLEKAEAKIPKKEVKQRVVDSDGKITTRLSFEEKKPPSKLSHAAKISGDAVLHGVHREVRQSNDGDNAGVDAANTLAEDAESAYQVGREIHHAHALKPYRKAHRAEKKADKANVKGAESGVCTAERRLFLQSVFPLAAETRNQAGVRCRKSRTRHSEYGQGIGDHKKGGRKKCRGRKENRRVCCQAQKRLSHCRPDRGGFPAVH